MGFTIEDMLVASKDHYKMQMLAGKNGWSNSIKWIFMIEESTIVEYFTGKEMVVTTGLGFPSEEKVLELVEKLAKKHASALIINTGYYIKEISDRVISLCDELGLPLLIVPWEISISDMVQELTLRVIQQDQADEVMSRAMIRAIEQPTTSPRNLKELLPYFDLDGEFQIFLISTEHLDVMDTVDRRRLSYRLQIYLENITHNGNFFYYDSYFVMAMNNVSRKESKEIIEGFVRKVAKRMPDTPVYVGVGSVVSNISNLYLTYQRARSAILMGFAHEQRLVYFDQMGISRLFYSLPDQALLDEMGSDLIAPLIEYDAKHATDYVSTLRLFLENNGSIQAVAEKSYAHRNTVIYHLKNIKKMLGTDLATPEERLPYLFACLIYQR